MSATSSEMKYGVMCKAGEIETFIVWFNTNNAKDAALLASCISNNKNCLIAMVKE